MVHSRPAHIDLDTTIEVKRRRRGRSPCPRPAGGHLLGRTAPAHARGEAARRLRAAGQPRTARIRLQSNWGADPASDLSTLNHLAPWYVDALNRILGATPTRVLVLDGDGLPGRAQRHSGIRAARRLARHERVCHCLSLDAVAGEPLLDTTSAAPTVKDVDALRAALGTGPLAADAPAVAQLHLIGLAAEASKDSGGWAEIEKIDTL